jgi:hypothetical protein
LTGFRADPTGFELTGGAAAVTRRWCRLAIIAIFARFYALVAALRNSHAGLACHAREGGVLHRTGGVASIIVDGVLVVTDFAGSDGSVTADDVLGALSLGRVLGTSPILLHVAGTVAAVTWQRVAVVASFDATLIVDAVAAAFRRLSFAPAVLRAAASS